MKYFYGLSGVPALLFLAYVTSAHAAGTNWQPIEKTQTYAISGRTGAQLYHSIGQNGPRINKSNGKNIRTIAHTNFTLTWARRYKTDDGNCTLVSATPKLTITYTLPKPAQKLPPRDRKIMGSFYCRY